ncbi:hypothetical protein [African swine fever virus]|uniref:Uncharacterized protein n=1 Tax=African swine fever virus TaxID=10497 RepID=A0A3G1EV56_ASF|nr:hypothetical protein F8221_gp148 [African swine fever virus]AOO54453.1 hypothetical protein AFSV47Ss_0148 [African swine fever virus]QID21277.1 hypothetical protein AFSV47Ss_0148 [African swine fever virus]QIM06789.1 hypothetical protein [African swine fever virus]QIM07024.1 hypothetical protein [African swine fever virus]QIM07259.1 hypothetical protein [African swine fever virus]
MPTVKPSLAFNPVLWIITDGFPSILVLCSSCTERMALMHASSKPYGLKPSCCRTRNLRTNSSTPGYNPPCLKKNFHALKRIEINIDRSS